MRLKVLRARIVTSATKATLVARTKAEWNGHHAARIHHPLIPSITETGDMLDARLRAGHVVTADDALNVIRDVVDRAHKSFCDVANPQHSLHEQPGIGASSSRVALRPRQCGAAMAHFASINAVRIKVPFLLDTLDHSPTDL